MKTNIHEFNWKKQNITNTIKTKSVLIPFHPILGLS